MITDPVPFLANIALIAHADGKLSAGELSRLEAIRNDLKLKKSDYNTALRIVEQGTHKLVPVGSFGDRVKNLEFMLQVAYSDDELGKAEADLVVEFAKAIKVTQEQLNVIRAEVVDSLRNLSRSCPACGNAAEKDARFCNKCGAGLASTEAVAVQFLIPAKGYAIEFAESTAANFPRALEIARAANAFESCQKNKKTWHLAVYSSGDIREAIPLAQSLSGIRNRRVYLDGQEQQWDEVFGFAWCAAQRASAYRPVAYCFGRDENRLNVWGCKQANLDWTEWADWFSYGRWEKAGTFGKTVHWRFDKERIRHELATNLFRYRYCPFLAMNLTEAVLRRLPDTVNPETDKDWAYNRCYEQLPGCIRIYDREKIDGMVFQNDYWSDGVRPKGLQTYMRILRAALGDIGADAKQIEAHLQ